MSEVEQITIDVPEGTILSKNITLPYDCKVNGINQNIMVLGNAMDGVERHFISPNIKQGSSNFIITDKGGSMFYEYSAELEAMGYSVKKIDLVDCLSNVTYDPFHYVRKKDDSRTCRDLCDFGYVEDICKLVKTIVKYTVDASCEYFAKIEEDIFVILMLFEYLAENNPSFCGFLSRLHNITSSIHAVSEIRELSKDVAEMCSDKQCKTIIGRINTYSDKAIESILVSLEYDMACFYFYNKRCPMKNDTLNLDEYFDTKCALFISCSLNDSFCKPLLGLIIEQAADFLYRPCLPEYNRPANYMNRFIVNAADIIFTTELMDIIQTSSYSNMSFCIITGAFFQLGNEPIRTNIISYCDSILTLGILAIDDAIKLSTFAAKYRPVGQQTGMTSSQIMKKTASECFVFINGYCVKKDKKYDSV